MSNHATIAEKFISDGEKLKWHDASLWSLRVKRDAAIHNLEDWETLRTLASEIKSHTLSQLDQYLVEFEKNATQNGIHIHWAEDAAEHNAIVQKILDEKGAKSLVKSKSILTEECGLNHFLEKKGYEIIETDLGERIIQFAGQYPSHLVAPAIHLDRDEIGEIFHQSLGTEKGETDPQKLTEIARQHLREKFIRARVAMTGVNFAMAETGGFVVCTNEGNADMGVHFADVHIASMGIEKLIPQEKHLGVFLRLLARSATGQKITVYTSHFKKPEKGKELHVILVDNGRSARLGDAQFSDSLKCIRCGACLNTCPVYRRSGGYSYESTIAGPLGAVLMPSVDPKKYASLPFASTLCGSCNQVCPVKIDLQGQLYSWRQRLTKEGHTSAGEKWMMKIAGWLLSSPRWFSLAGKVGKLLLKNNLVAGKWLKSRDLPTSNKQTFSAWYKEKKDEK